jgi:AraC-like DNA-binding protein/quercetin dioxygenase-like cupin family protein
MVKTGQSPIRPVRFQPPDQSVGEVEVNSLQGIRDRGGPHEFLTLQRLDFDLLFRVERGTTTHTVDFQEHTLRAGDVLWVRAGQVHQWGAITDIEGPVVLFGPHAVDERTTQLVRSRAARLQNHWPAADLSGTQVDRALALLTGTDPDPRSRDDVRQAMLAHGLAVLLLQLALVDPSIGASTAPARTHEAFTWFRDHLEERFREWHKVAEYADRLGYSSRTLNRLARLHTGLTAKQLVDERVLLEAKRLLSHSDAPAAEIAEQLGFDDASNFSSWFRRQADTTPGAFRIASRGAG